MPGHRCIAPGCKSGYDSCKNKYHFFTVPKDDIKLQQWTRAIPRKNFLIKPRQVVCERHFHEEEIIRKRIMTDKNGTILAEVCLLYISSFLNLLKINRYLIGYFIVFISFYLPIG